MATYVFLHRGSAAVKDVSVTEITLHHSLTSSVAGYKWLKYVPNGILKTAQAAEWKVQAWMLGRPPTLAYKGIGFEVQASPQLPTGLVSPPLDSSTSTLQEKEARNSDSTGFSDYDDLRDFDGRFDSMSTLGRRSICSTRSRTYSESKSSKHVATRKTSKGFLGILKGVSNQSAGSTSERPQSSGGPGKKLKVLRSMGSLKGRGSAPPKQPSKKTSTPSLSSWTPSRLTEDVGLGLDGLEWDGTVRGISSPVTFPRTKSVKSDASLDMPGDASISGMRAGGRRSVSFGASTKASSRISIPPVPPMPSLPSLPPSPRSELTPTPTESTFQAQLGNALIAASHAESARGTHSDLVQILNHDRQPWGFSYHAYPHAVRVWYGDKDEKIGENAVRWMESTMGPDKCQVNVVKGADHALMFRSGVVVEVLEYVSDCWRSGTPFFSLPCVCATDLLPHRLITWDSKLLSGVLDVIGFKYRVGLYTSPCIYPVFGDIGPSPFARFLAEVLNHVRLLPPTPPTVFISSRSPRKSTLDIILVLLCLLHNYPLPFQYSFRNTG